MQTQDSFSTATHLHLTTRSKTMNCLHCSEDFTPLAKSHVYCSFFCSELAKGRKVKENRPVRKVIPPKEVEDLFEELHEGYRNGSMLPDRLPF